MFSISAWKRIAPLYLSHFSCGPSRELELPPVPGSAEGQSLHIPAEPELCPRVTSRSTQPLSTRTTPPIKMPDLLSVQSSRLCPDVVEPDCRSALQVCLIYSASGGDSEPKQTSDESKRGSNHHYQSTCKVPLACGQTCNISCVNTVLARTVSWTVTHTCRTWARAVTIVTAVSMGAHRRKWIRIATNDLDPLRLSEEDVTTYMVKEYYCYCFLLVVGCCSGIRSVCCCQICWCLLYVLMRFPGGGGGQCHVCLHMKHIAATPLCSESSSEAPLSKIVLNLWHEDGKINSAQKLMRLLLYCYYI